VLEYLRPWVEGGLVPVAVRAPKSFLGYLSIVTGLDIASWRKVGRKAHTVASCVEPTSLFSRRFRTVLVLLGLTGGVDRPTVTGSSMGPHARLRRL